MAETLLITAGDVIDVQLTSETVVIENAGGRRIEERPGHIRNRMRLFVREDGGREQKYDFDDSELGVRETQRVAIVRGQLKRWPEPANLVLFNLTSGEKDCFERGLFAYLSHKPFFGPLMKAAVLALGTGVIFYLVSHYLVRHEQGAVMSGFLAVMFAFLAYPLFWWICGTWDRVSERIRYKAARKKFVADMEGRVRAYAKPAAASSPATP